MHDLFNIIPLSTPLSLSKTTLQEQQQDYTHKLDMYMWGKASERFCRSLASMSSSLPFLYKWNFLVSCLPQGGRVEAWIDGHPLQTDDLQNQEILDKIAPVVRPACTCFSSLHCLALTILYLFAVLTSF